MTTFNEAQYAVHLAANPTKHFATFAGRVIDFTAFITKYETDTASTVTQQDVTNFLYTSAVSAHITGKAIGSYAAETVMIGQVIDDILTPPTDPAAIASLMAPSIPSISTPPSGDFVAFYVPVNTTIESTIITYLTSNPGTFIVPSATDDVYYDVTTYYETLVANNATAFTGVTTNIDAYNLVKFKKSSPTNSIDSVIIEVETEAGLSNVRVQIYSNIGYTQFDETSYSALLAGNPTRFYAIYNVFVYDFTDFYTAIDASLALMFLPPLDPIPQQDVTIYNTVSDIATNIDNTKSAYGLTEDNVFDILNEIDVSINSWSIKRVGQYGPTNTYTNIDVINNLFGSQFFARIDDIYYDITIPMMDLTNVGLQYIALYSDTASVSGAGLVAETRPNIHNRLIEQDHITYSDVLSFRDGIVSDFNSGDPRVTKYGTPPLWTQQGTLFMTPGVFTGIVSIMSSDGTTIGIGQRTTAGPIPNASTVSISIYRFLSGSWQQIGATFTTGVFDTANVELRGRRIAALSANGQVLVIGDDSVNSSDGQVSVYECSSYGVGGTWNLRGAPIDGALGGGTQFGYTVALSSDGTAFAASTNAGGKTVSTYGYNSFSNTWSLRASGLSAIIPFGTPDAFGLSLSLSDNGFYIVIGDADIGGAGFGAVRVFEGFSSPTQRGNIISGGLISGATTIKQLGFSVACSGGTRITIGAPDSNREGSIDAEGAVMQYEIMGGVWTQRGQTIWGNDDDALGWEVSCGSSDGFNSISASAMSGSIPGVADTGYVRVYEFFGFPENLWMSRGTAIASDTPAMDDLNDLTQLSGSGNRAIVGAPNISEARVMIFNTNPEAFQNTYSVTRTQSVSGNFITDPALEGTDNDPQSLPLTINEINNPSPGPVFTAFSALPNTTEPGFTKEVNLNAGKGTLFLNADGSFRYDDNGTSLTSFGNVSYGLSNGVTTTLTVTPVTFSLITLPLTVTVAPTTGSFTRNQNGASMSSGLSGTLTGAGGILPYTFGVQGGTVAGGMSTLVTAFGTMVVDIATGAFTYSTSHNTPIVTTDMMTMTVEGANAAMSTNSYDVAITVNPEFILNDPPNGSVISALGNPVPLFTANLTGTLIRSGGTAPFDFGISGGTVSPTEVVLSGTFGTLTVNRTTGAYVYVVTSLPVMSGAVNDVFTVNCTDTLETVNATFTIIHSVDQALDLAVPTGATIFKQVGQPLLNPLNIMNAIVATGGSPAYSYDVQGSAIIAPNTVSLTGLYGTLVMNTLTGAYTHTPNATAILPDIPGNYLDDFTVSVQDSLFTSVMKTLTITINVRIPPVLVDPPPESITKISGNPALTPSFISGTLAVTGGLMPFDFSIQGGTPNPVENVRVGTFGTLIVNRLSGVFTYSPNPAAIPDTVGVVSDIFVVEVTDAFPDFDDAPLIINFTILNPLNLMAPPIGSIVKRIGNPPLDPVTISGTLVATGGTMPFDFGIQDGMVSPTEVTLTGLYGVLVVNRVTGAYLYTPIPANIPDEVDIFVDTFMTTVEDAINDTDVEILTIEISVSMGISLLPVNPGNVVKAVGEPTITTTDLTGTLQTVGQVLPITFGIMGGTVIGNISTVVTLNGTLSLNITTGVYSYVHGPIIDVIDRFFDTFVFTVVDFENATNQTTYVVEFEINPQLLINELVPSAGSVTRNTNKGGFDAVGLTGTMVASGGVNPYEYGIDGVIPNPSFPIVSRNSVFGTLTVNRFTGEYTFNVTSLPSIPGVLLNSFIMTAIDANGKMQTINYDVSFTVKDTPLGILPVFTDVESRSKITYWDVIVHELDLFARAANQAPAAFLFENTEILVIGSTESSVDPQKNSDAILRELLTLAIAKSDLDTGGDDVVNRIKTNTKDMLATTGRSGELTYSFTIPISGSSSTRIVELADILSSKHPRFLLNRYRSNVGEAVIVFYNADATDAELDAIVEQIAVLDSIGVGNIILTLIGLTLDPVLQANLGYLFFLQDLTNRMKNKIITLIGPQVIPKIIESSLRFVPATPTSDAMYQNLFSKDYDINPGTLPLFSAIALIPPTPRDSERDLRIIITDVDGTTAVGTIIYDELTFAPQVFIASRIVSPVIPGLPQSERSLGAITPLTNSSIISSGSDQKDEITITGQNVNNLKPGDVLYSFSHTFQQPAFIDLLVSVVAGVNRPIEDPNPVIGFTIIMQIDDSVAFPNNPAFAGQVVPPILKKFDSNTLAETLPVGNILESGYDYLLRVQLPDSGDDSFAAAPLEAYQDFPRLGFVTLYFGRESNNPTIGITPFGRGAVINVDRT